MLITPVQYATTLGINFFGRTHWINHRKLSLNAEFKLSASFDLINVCDGPDSTSEATILLNIEYKQCLMNGKILIQDAVVTLVYFTISK